MTGLELPPGGQPTQKARYEFYQTSAAIIQRAGLKLYHPEPENIPDEQKCHEFIREPLPTDKRKNLLECRLRALCVYIDHRYKTADHMPLLETALSKKWAYKSFTRMVEKGATGSAVVTGPGGISLFFQTPRDGMPFIAFCMTELPAEARRQQSDWVCLLLVTPDFDFRSVLHEDVFPADYGRLFPDFMYIPVRLLEDQVELIRDGLHGPTESLAQQTETLLHMNREDFSTTRKALFEIERTVRQLRDRWRFARELANTLMRCFAEIVRAHKLEVTAGSSIDRLYSKVLVQRVQTQIAIVEMMDLDLDSLPSAIQEQHRKIEAELNLLIAESSYISAEEARRDGSSMKTIAVITLIFMPASTVATIFGLSMFNWNAADGEAFISNRVWIYLVVALGLTAVVVVGWLIWWFVINKPRQTTRGLDLRGPLPVHDQGPIHREHEGQTGRGGRR